MGSCETNLNNIVEKNPYIKGISIFYLEFFYVKHIASLITKCVYSQIILVFKNELKNISLCKNLTLLCGPPYFEGSLSKQTRIVTVWG